MSITEYCPLLTSITKSIKIIIHSNQGNLISYFVGNRIRMEPTLQDKGHKEKGVLKDGFTKGQTNQVMGPINHKVTNCQGNIRYIRSRVDAVKFPRKR